MKDLLSIDESLKALYSVTAISELSEAEKQTYFSQTVTDVPEIDDLVDTGNYDTNLIKIFNNLKDMLNI